MSTFTKIHTWATASQASIQCCSCYLCRCGHFVQKLGSPDLLFLLCFVNLVSFFSPPTYTWPAQHLDGLDRVMSMVTEDDLEGLSNWSESKIPWPQELQEHKGSVHSLNLSLQKQQQMQGQTLPWSYLWAGVMWSPLSWPGRADSGLLLA